MIRRALRWEKLALCGLCGSLRGLRRRRRRATRVFALVLCMMSMACVIREITKRLLWHALKIRGNCGERWAHRLHCEQIDVSARPLLKSAWLLFLLNQTIPLTIDFCEQRSNRIVIAHGAEEVGAWRSFSPDPSCSIPQRLPPALFRFLSPRDPTLGLVGSSYTGI